jgi:hypothetical protein
LSLRAAQAAYSASLADSERAALQSANGLYLVLYRLNSDRVDQLLLDLWRQIENSHPPRPSDGRAPLPKVLLSIPDFLRRPFTEAHPMTLGQFASAAAAEMANHLHHPDRQLSQLLSKVANKLMMARTPAALKPLATLIRAAQKQCKKEVLTVGDSAVSDSQAGDIVRKDAVVGILAGLCVRSEPLEAACLAVRQILVFETPRLERESLSQILGMARGAEEGCR